MGQFDKFNDTNGSTALAEKAWEKAVSDDIDAALYILSKNKNSPASCRFYEIKSSISDIAFGLSKDKLYLEMNIESILSRIVLDMENPRLYIDICDFFLNRNQDELALICLEKAIRRLTTTGDDIWSDEIRRRFDEIKNE